MSTYPPRSSEMIAVVSRTGEIRERHRGEITVHAGLSRYLRTAARVELPTPVCFAWDTSPDPATLPKSPTRTVPGYCASVSHRPGVRPGAVTSRSGRSRRRNVPDSPGVNSRC
ncbi:hypothetical protein [Streptomyces sp. NPDC059076]|uniref:hypothetical protein n=1 Tax=unclassified Streptomyces TaxID=2593676 RepID=UPI0036977769